MSLFPPQTITLDAALRDVGSTKWQVRTHAAYALRFAEDADDRKQASEALIPLLEDDHPEVRAESAFSLGELRASDAAPRLIKALADTASEVRQSACISLGQIGLRSAFPAIADALTSGPPDLRFQAVTSLLSIDRAEALPHLLRALHDEDNEVVKAAALGLGQCGGNEARKALVTVLEHPDRDVRFEVAYALSCLEDQRGLELLLDFVTDDDHAWHAAEALEQLSAPAAIPALARAVQARTGATPERLRLAAALLAIAHKIPAQAPLRDDDLQAAIRDAHSCLVQGLQARKLYEASLAAELLGRVGDSSAHRALTHAATTRRGRRIQAALDDALAVLAKRDDDAEPDLAANTNATPTTDKQ